MTDQQQPPTGDGVPQVPNEGSWSAQEPIPAEHTRPLPPFQQPPSSTSTAIAPARRRGAITAAVLGGALLLGGAAGIGGAAWYDAWQGDSPASSSSSSPAAGGVITANDSTAQARSVEQVSATVLPSVVKINVTGQSESGSGSGIILTKDGRILTNNHVVQVAGKDGTITVNFNNGQTLKAKAIGTDPVTDIAVIQAEGAKDLTPAVIGNSGGLKVGQSVVAVGSPFGLNATVTSGIVSALNRPVSVSTAPESQSQTDPFSFGQSDPQQSQGADLSTTYPAIQTDAAINPGNSGGPLVDLGGRVVGINSSIRTSDSSSTSGGSIGLGFAIPIDEVLPIVNQIVDGQSPTHARLGVSVSDATGNSLEQGAKIASIDSGGAAAGTALKAGDVITKVDNDVISGSESLVATVRGHRPGDRVTLTYVRGSKTDTVTVKLGSDAGATSS